MRLARVADVARATGASRFRSVRAAPAVHATGRRAMWPAIGVALAAALAVALLAAQFNPYLGDYGDDAEFLILGQGLATGQGYAWVNSPERPAHNRYPPGYPALLAVTMLVSGTRDQAYAAIVPAKLVTAATFLGSALLLWPLARRRLPAPWAAGAVAIYLLNPFAIRFAGEVMSDLPYVLVLLAALVWADRLAARPTQHSALSTQHSFWAWVGLGALLALGAYVRSIGLAAAVGVLPWAWWRGGRRSGAIATTAFVVLMLPWWVRDAMLAGTWRYLEELLAAQYQDPGAGTVGSTDLLARALDNALFLIGKPGVFGVAGMLAGIAAAVVVALGYWRSLRSLGGAAEWA
ncbi:MAG: hypothetical protein ACRDJN_29960, partial [Chloroflexota bacterium]